MGPGGAAAGLEQVPGCICSVYPVLHCRWADPTSEWPEDAEFEGGHWPSPLADISAICFLFGIPHINIHN